MRTTSEAACGPSSSVTAAIHFVTCERGTIESIELAETAGFDWIVDYKCAAAPGDRVEPAVGYYERPAHFIYTAQSRPVEERRRGYRAASKIVAGDPARPHVHRALIVRLP